MIRPMNSSKPEVKVKNGTQGHRSVVLMCMAQKTKILCPSYGASRSRVDLNSALTGSRS